MTEQPIRRRARSMMIATGIVAFVALIGSVMLSSSGRPGYAIIWLGLGIFNVALYAMNLRIYRRFEPHGE